LADIELLKTLTDNKNKTVSSKS